ncbi:MAG: hypothetical protein HRT47_05220 [Candidatus Caenarcaniphilales bacterium]|nr:hypothetical protein [Candidatus Caenarcaniphilales bacterium]
MVDVKTNNQINVRNLQDSDKLPSGEGVEENALLSKQSSQEHHKNTSKASTSPKASPEELHNQEQHQKTKKNFFNLIYKHLKDEENTNKKFTLGVLLALVKASEEFLDHPEIQNSHIKLKQTSEDLAKTQEPHEEIDLNILSSEGTSFKDALIQHLEKIFEHKPDLIDSENASKEEKSPEKKTEKREYKNKFFGAIFNKIEPFVNWVTQKQVPISLIGSATHLGDALSQISENVPGIPSIPKGLEKPLGKLSLWWSKAINPLGNILIGVKKLANNNLADALFRGSLLGKLTVKNPANLGVPVGAFLDYEISHMLAQMDGNVKELKEEFDSPMESLKYSANLYFNQLKSYWNKIKKGENLIENIGMLYGVPMMGLSAIVGCLTLKDDVNGPWAKAVGFARNSSGGFMDIIFTKKRVQKIQETIEKSQGRKASLKEILSDHQIQFMVGYVSNSILDLTMRWWKNPVTTIIQSQISNSLYEIANGLVGKDKSLIKNDIVANHQKIIDEREKNENVAKNNLVSFDRIKEIAADLISDLKKEPAAALA